MYQSHLTTKKYVSNVRPLDILPPQITVPKTNGKQTTKIKTCLPKHSGIKADEVENDSVSPRRVAKI